MVQNLYCFAIAKGDLSLGDDFKTVHFAKQKYLFFLAFCTSWCLPCNNAINLFVLNFVRPKSKENYVAHQNIVKTHHRKV